SPEPALWKTHLNPDRETRRRFAGPKSNALTLLPAPRILDKASHFRYLSYDFRFLRFIAAVYWTI
ncbi:MAG: hypothetical protein OEM61_12490, partial [Desulfobacteraceae bacterium]|nr:hypothetical protein [Desulfobacteraceae bacterium]